MPSDINEIPAAQLGGSPSVKVQLFEVLAFCFLIVPGLLFSSSAGQSLKENFTPAILGVMLSELALVFLVLFFLWRNRENLSRVGWISKGLIKEIFLGIALFIPIAYVISYVDSGLSSLGVPTQKGHIPSFLEPSGISQDIMAGFLVVVVAISEETIFRGYLILRFKSITGSASAAIVVSTLIFAAGHGYEGIGGVIIVGVMGAIFALIYLWRKSIAAPIAMHFIQDFIAIIVLPALINNGG